MEARDVEGHEGVEFGQNLVSKFRDTCSHFLKKYSPAYVHPLYKLSGQSDPPLHLNTLPALTRDLHG